MKRTSPKALMSGVATAALALSLAACGGGDDGNDGDGGGDGAYKWGINASLSGVTAYYGEGMEVGIRAYVDEVNAEGGINGHQIELVTLDNAADAARTTTNTTQLAAAEGVNAIFGFVLSANCSAATPVAERYRVPLACMSLAEKNPYAYSLGADNTRAAGAMFEAAKEVTGDDAPTAAVVHINTLTSVGLADALEEKADAAGVEIATRQEIDIAATDVSAQVARIVRAEPDVVLISNTGPGFLSVVKGVRNAGVDAPFVWVDGTGNLPSLAESKDPGIHALTTYKVVEPGAADGAAADFLEATEGQLPADDILSLNGAYSVPAYMIARLFGAALEECGHPCSGEDLRKVLDQTTIELPGLDEEFGYTEDEHYPYSSWNLYRIEGPKVEFVNAYDVDE